MLFALFFELVQNLSRSFRYCYTMPSASRLTCSSVSCGFPILCSLLYKFFTGGFGTRRFLKCFLTKLSIPFTCFTKEDDGFFAASSSFCFFSSSSCTCSFDATSVFELSFSEAVTADSSSYGFRSFCRFSFASASTSLGVRPLIQGCTDKLSVGKSS